MKIAVALLTLASFGTLFAADKPADGSTDTSAKSHKKHAKKHKKGAAATDAASTPTK